MNHTYIEEHQIADRYVMGTLPPEEAEIFEDHYLSCPQCLDRLELAESMQRGFKRAAGQDAARLVAARQLALVAWLARLSRSRQAATLLLALLVVAVVALPGALAWRRLGAVDRELAEARRALKQERERSTAGSQSAAEIGRLRSEIEANRGDLDRERQSREQAAQQLAQANEQLAQARVPQENAPLLYLGVTRGSGPDDLPVLHRPPGAGWAFLGFQVDPPFAGSYRWTLRNARGQELRHGTGLRPTDDEGSMSLSVPGSLLMPDDYTITIEGVGRPAATASRFVFRVRP